MGVVLLQLEVGKSRLRKTRQLAQGHRDPEKEAGLACLSVLVSHTLHLRGQ